MKFRPNNLRKLGLTKEPAEQPIDLNKLYEKVKKKKKGDEKK